MNLDLISFIAPEIAIAHARPNNDVHQVGLSLLKLNQHVAFCDEDHYASLIFVLSAIDNHSHLSVLQNLATVLGDNQNSPATINCKKRTRH